MYTSPKPESVTIYKLHVLYSINMMIYTGQGYLLDYAQQSASLRTNNKSSLCLSYVLFPLFVCNRVYCHVFSG